MFFFYPRKWKVPEKTFFGTFRGFFLGQIFFSRPLKKKKSRAVWSFLGHNLKFFLGKNLFFSRAEIQEFQGIFSILTGKSLIFFLGQGLFFLGLDFDVFFSGIIFSFREVFKIFSRAVLNLLRQKIEHFLVRNFFSCGIKKTLTSIERRCLSWEVGDHLTGLSQAL